MKVDPKIIETAEKQGPVTHAVRHIGSDSAVAVFCNIEAAQSDCNDRNSRSESHGLQAKYDVVTL